MNKTGTIILIIFLALIAIGLGVFAFLFSIGKIELNQNYYNIFNRQSENLIDSKEFEDINDIYVGTNIADVYVEYSSDKKYKVELYSDNVNNYSIKLDNEDLRVDLEEKEKVGFFPKQPRVIIYVPTEYKNKINVKAKTSDIKSVALKNASFKVEVTTGDVEIEEANVLDITTTTGDIENNNVEVANIKCKTGDIRLGTVNNSLDIVTTTGDVRINTIDLKENSSIQTTTGDVRIDNKNEIYVETESKTGDVRVNNNADRFTELSLHIKVTTGDIKVG